MTDEAVRKSRELNPNCGCEKRGDRQFNCSYHEGFIDGCEAGRSAAIQECAADAARIAEYHHQNHCDNNDTTYRNCGSAIAADIKRIPTERDSVLALKER